MIFNVFQGMLYRGLDGSGIMAQCLATPRSAEGLIGIHRP